MLTTVYVCVCVYRRNIYTVIHISHYICMYGIQQKKKKRKKEKETKAIVPRLGGVEGGGAEQGTSYPRRPSSVRISPGYRGSQPARHPVFCW